MTAPLAAWAFDEGTGTTTADATGNGHTLTLNNATWQASGHTNSAIQNTAATQGATGTVPAITGPVTLMCWVKPLQLTSGTSYLICGILQSFNGNTDIGLWTQRGDFGTTNVLQGDIRVSGNLDAVNGTSALTVGTWFHVALTYDGTSAKLYRNGSLETTVSVSGTISLGTTFYVAGGGPATEVVVDDVRLYNTALSQASISSLMNIPVFSSMPNPFVVSQAIPRAATR